MESDKETKSYYDEMARIRETINDDADDEKNGEKLIKMLELKHLADERARSGKGYDASLAESPFKVDSYRRRLYLTHHVPPRDTPYHNREHEELKLRLGKLSSDEKWLEEKMRGKGQFNSEIIPEILRRREDKDKKKALTNIAHPYFQDMNRVYRKVKKEQAERNERKKQSLLQTQNALLRLEDTGISRELYENYEREVEITCASIDDERQDAINHAYKMAKIYAMIDEKLDETRLIAPKTGKFFPESTTTKHIQKHKNSEHDLRILESNVDTEQQLYDWDVDPSEISNYINEREKLELLTGQLTDREKQIEVQLRRKNKDNKEISKAIFEYRDQLEKDKVLSDEKHPLHKDMLRIYEKIAKEEIKKDQEPEKDLYAMRKQIDELAKTNPDENAIEQLEQKIISEARRVYWHRHRVMEDAYRLAKAHAKINEQLKELEGES